MNDRDYAVVVGISRYPSFGPTPADANDLAGPDRDAQAIYGWLTDAGGGDVPADNIRCVRSGAYPNPFPLGGIAPRRADVVNRFRWLENIAERNDRNGNGLAVGRRLYLYVSGHGFGRHRLDGAVYAANATLNRPGHLEASLWAQWFQESSYFDEYVLWMDCCMMAESGSKLDVVGFRTVSPTKPATVFQSFAARFQGLAVEAEMEDGDVHGAFTWALLKGLRGANADPVTGAVTTSRLCNYLTSAMRGFMTAEQLADPQVSKEPDFGPVDEIVLAVVPPAAWKVTLDFGPSAVGHRWQILTADMEEKSTGIAAAEALTVRLPASVYVVRVEAATLTVPFQVIGKDQTVHVG